MTESTAAIPVLMLIDDDAQQLGNLETGLKERLNDQAEILTARPERDDDTRRLLDAILAKRPTLVVTDHDLTAHGPPGLMGDSIIAWCRSNAIPVGDYSRKLDSELEEPDIFEFRFSNKLDLAVEQISELVLGFHELSILLAKQQNQSESWSTRLAESLGHPSTAASFSLYSARTGASHAMVIERLEKAHGSNAARDMLATYVLGHLLSNGILRYPGPLMNAHALCSYVAAADDRATQLAELFKAARYAGPFGRQTEYFWQEKVDDILADLAEAAEKDGDPGDDEFRRDLVATKLDPGAHACERCGGNRGGFRCPYTTRTVCDRKDCSVSSTSWIPPGAYLTRVEKDYYDQWSPLLGL